MGPGGQPKAPAPEELLDLIHRLEADEAPRDEYQFQTPFSAFRREIEERGDQVAPNLVAEEIAFMLHPHDRQEASSWGIYFGPFMSGQTKAGDPWESPPLSAITPEVLAYWRLRADQTSHPVMRARYADLLWELPKVLKGPRPDAAMARLAIDSYLGAIESRRYEHDVTAIQKSERALAIATSVGDEGRMNRARDAMLTLEDSVAVDAMLGLWGFCFDAFLEPPNRHVVLSDEQRDKLVGDIESRLARFVAGPPDQYHPAGAEAAALRLAKHYRRLGQHADVARVLRAYGAVVRRMHGTAAPLVVAHCVEQLYVQFKAFGLNADADALSELLRRVGQETLADMKQLTVETKIPTEKVEAFFSALLDGSSSEALVRTILHFIPRRDEAETRLRELAKQAPLSFMVTHSLMDAEGRTVAQIGPLDADLEGHLAQHISQGMQLSSPWLREAMKRLLERGAITADYLLEFLGASPLFPDKRKAILKAGLEAYVKGDAVACMHILIPQVEQALRQLASLIGAPIFAPRHGGGFRVKTMDTLLQERALGNTLGEDVVTYFRVLFTDARGWNLRNDVSHGLLSEGVLTMSVADRVVHALLVLGLVQEDEAVPKKDAP